MDNSKKNKEVEKKSSSDGTIFTKETFGMLMVLFSALCIVCLITRGAVFSDLGIWVNYFMFGALGGFAFPYAVLVGYFGVTMVTGKSIPFSKKTSGYISAFFVFLLLLIHSATSAKYMPDASFGEYLTSCYNAASEGFVGSTGGGVVAGLVSYWGMKLFTPVGVYIIASIALVVVVASFIRSLKKGNRILARGNVDVVKQDAVSAMEKEEPASAPAQQTVIVHNDPFSGIADAPMPTEPAVSKPKNPLNITEGAEFSFLGKKEAPANIKLNKFDGGLNIAGVIEPARPTPQDDLNAKLKYIRTPKPIDVEETLSRLNSEASATPKNSGVSSTISRNDGKRIITTDYVPQEYQGFDEPVQKPTELKDTPTRQEYNSDRPIGRDSATDRAITFNNRYIDTPEVNEVASSEASTDSIEKLLNHNASEMLSFNEAFRVEEARILEEKKKAEEAKRLEEERQCYEENKRLEELRLAEEARRLEEEKLLEEQKRAEEARLLEERRLEEQKKAEEARLLEEQRKAEKQAFDQEILRAEEERISSINDVYFSGPAPTDEPIPEDKPERSRVIGFGSSSVTRRSEPKVSVAPVQQVSQQSSLPVEEKTEELEKKPEPINRPYFVPPLDYFSDHKREGNTVVENHEENLHKIEETLSNFKIPVEGKSYIQGPSFTRYELSVPAGISVRNVLKYDYDLMAALEVSDGVRILAPIPGKNLIGVEVANKVKTMVSLKEVLAETADRKRKKGALMFSIGKSLIGESIEDNLAKGPHYLVAGSTGSGKSVCLNSMLISLIMRYSPEDMKLILIDPKTVEFSPYEHLPHLVTDEIISDLKKVLAVLDWAIEEMERRYRTFRECGSSVVDIDGYNDTEPVLSGKVQRMPRIVIVIDELADLMQQVKRDLEGKIQRLTAKARSAGIHLVLATQRPSVDVITGVIKSNLPSRIAFKVMNFMDSQTILSEAGAEKLLGYGDMLYRNSGMPNCERYQGTFISPAEIHKVVQYIIENNEAYFNEELTKYLENAVRPPEPEHSGGGLGMGAEGGGGEDYAFIQALKHVISSGQASISMIQRRLQMGYPRAASMIDKMEQLGYISPNEGSKARRVLITEEEFNEKYGNNGDA